MDVVSNCEERLVAGHTLQMTGLVIPLDRHAGNCAVHALHPPVSPRMIEFGQPASDARLTAGPVKEVAAST